MLRLRQQEAYSFCKAHGLAVAERSELLPSERKAYLNGLYDAIAGLEAARVVMQKAVKRIESSPLGESVVDDAA